jgi:hypothetical protein
MYAYFLVFLPCLLFPIGNQIGSGSTSDSDSDNSNTKIDHKSSSAEIRNFWAGRPFLPLFK